VQEGKKKGFLKKRKSSSNILFKKYYPIKLSNLLLILPKRKGEKLHFVFSHWLWLAIEQTMQI